MLFRDYDRAALDAQYNNRDKVPDSAAIGDRWTAASAEARAQLSCDLDIAYGAHPRQGIDVFPAARRDAPILVFVHGGYWHLRDRTLGHFLAPTYVAAGVTLACVGYRLCPEVKVGDIVEDVKAAIRHVHANAADLGGDARRVFVAGHSAGGHLAASMCGPLGVPELLQGGCSVSGLHDLEPIRLCYLNDVLGLDAGEAARLSPMRAAEALKPGPAKLPPLILTVGGDEGPEYLRQRDGLRDALATARQPVEVVDLPGRNHFTALDAFGDPHHPLCQAMLRLILAPRF